MGKLTWEVKARLFIQIESRKKTLHNKVKAFLILLNEGKTSNKTVEMAAFYWLLNPIITHNPLVSILTDHKMGIYT